MKFDVVIGNPPYNNGADVDFMFIGDNISKVASAFIVPAKWHNAKPKHNMISKHTYGEFRNSIVPRMKQVVFYPRAKDIFDIACPSGITYFSVVKEKVDKAFVINKCTVIPEFNLSDYIDLKIDSYLHLYGRRIVKYIDGIQYQLPKYKDDFVVIIDNRTNCRSSEIIEKDPRYVSCKSFICSRHDDIKIICIDNRANGSSTCGVIPNTVYPEPFYRLDKPLSDVFVNLFYSNNIDECESFKSWFESKLVRFLIWINMVGNIIIEDNVMRFVKLPKCPFDHIFTDEELFDMYNIPDDVRDLIHRCIKKR